MEYLIQLQLKMTGCPASFSLKTNQTKYWVKLPDSARTAAEKPCSLFVEDI